MDGEQRILINNKFGTMSHMFDITKEEEIVPQIITVRIQDITGGFTVYRLNSDIKSIIFMEAYSKKMGRSKRTLRFMHHGVKIDPDKTLRELGIEDSDIIDVLFDQVGG